MDSELVFDQPHYAALNESRGRIVDALIQSLQAELRLKTAVDVGCGLGYFSSIADGLGLEMLAIDARAENINEASRRYPDINFRAANAEDVAIRSFGRFDLVLCLGLLYHLENPFAAIRNLFALTKQVAIVEGMCLPGNQPGFGVLDEGPTEDQGLQYVALYPTESGLIKLLYRSGYSFVYRLTVQPDHKDYHSSLTRNKARTFLVASTQRLSNKMLNLTAEPLTHLDPWEVRRGLGALVLKADRALRLLRRFLSKPLHQKRASIYSRLTRVFPRISLPVRLPFGAWWLARNDFIGARVLCDGFENEETNFVSRFLEAGMYVVDVGAHHGYYTLLASRKVGNQGKVLAIEPSPRERERLNLHLRVNRCRNVRVGSYALGETEGTAELNLVLGSENGCNSLRKPNGAHEIEMVPVSVRPLDRVLEECDFPRIDLLKLDVEGAEHSVLRGAGNLLRQRPRPVILAEVYDIRTSPWGYPAKQIISLLSANSFRWFKPLADGGLEGIDIEQEEYAGDFVAVPVERLSDVRNLLREENSRVQTVGEFPGSPMPLSEPASRFPTK
jgi:FkbM family methyltransferase